MDNTSRHIWQTAVALARTEAAMVRQTRYVVRLTSGAYASPNRHWTLETKHAEPFESLYAANGYAMNVLGLELDDYTVEAL
jgi:hypothetical protein